MLITTIIVSYNTAELTKKAILSVLEDAHRNNLEVEIIVVDNASDDDSVAVLKKLKRKYKQIKLILNKRNLGFAKANNQAIRQAGGDYIFLLNSDAYILPNTLAQLLQAFKKEKNLGIVSPLLMTPSKKLQNIGGDLPSLLNLSCQMFFIDDLPLIGSYLPSPQKDISKKALTKDLVYFGWVAGTAMMIKNEVIDQVGLLDEAIFMYAEDVDFCWRAKTAQFQVGVVPKAKVVHYGSASSSSKQAIIGEFRGLVYLFQKHKPHWQLPLLKLILFLGAWLRIITFKLIGKGKRVSIYRQALAAI